MRTIRSKAGTVTPFANPERQFQARREVSPAPIHNIYTFYESESSESDTENVDFENLTLEQYLALHQNNTRRRFTCPDDSTFEIKGQLLRELCKISFSGGPSDIAVKHISNVFDITSIFNAQESTLVQVFPLTLEGIAKRWFERTSTKCTKNWSDLKQNLLGLKDFMMILELLLLRVTTLAKEAVTKIDNNEDCKAIFTNDEAPLYTPLYYSPKEIEYFSANSGFLDNVELNNVTSIPDEDLKQTSPKQTTTHYVEPYIPPIPFLRRLEQHAEKALIHKTIESLKKIKSNRPFLKEIRQSNEYPKFMKDLVANKPLTMENEDIRINRRCSALLLN
ncbi:hypothetical protein Tco_0845580 [Tanacetum coccineum]